MTEEIEVNFQAKNPSGIKLLNRLYDGHLVLNDLGVRLDEQLNNEDEELTVPTQEDVDNLSDTFGKTVEASAILPMLMVMLIASRTILRVQPKILQRN